METHAIRKYSERVGNSRHQKIFGKGWKLTPSENIRKGLETHAIRKYSERVGNSRHQKIFGKGWKLTPSENIRKGLETHAIRKYSERVGNSRHQKMSSGSCRFNCDLSNERIFFFFFWCTKISESISSCQGEVKKIHTRIKQIKPCRKKFEMCYCGSRDFVYYIVHGAPAYHEKTIEIVCPDTNGGVYQEHYKYGNNTEAAPASVTTSVVSVYIII